MAGSREAARRANRAKVLAAARDLFAEVGFEAATAKMLAARAGVSVGGLFSNFASKEEMLAAIVVEAYDALAATLDQAMAEAGGSVRDRLKAAFAAGFRFERPRHALLMRQLGASWTWSHEFEAQSQARLTKPFHFVGRLLREGQETGEIGADVDLALAGDMLLGIYLRCFRHGWYRGLDVAAMSALMASQIDLLFGGFAPRE